MEVRGVTEADRPALEAFLNPRMTSSMYLLSELRSSNLNDCGPNSKCFWLVCLSEGQICGAAYHNSYGFIQVQAPEGAGHLVSTLASQSGHLIKGIVGLAAQVHVVRAALGAQDWRAVLDSKEELYTLELSALQRPSSLDQITVSLAAPQDVPVLVPLEQAYQKEENGQDLSDEECANSLKGRIGRLYLARCNEDCVAMTSFHATLPECVQVNDVFTPVASRGKGYGRGVVAASLLDVAKAGVARSVLFVGERNAAAKRTYEGLGYNATGEALGCVIFAEARRIDKD